MLLVLVVGSVNMFKTDFFSNRININIKHIKLKSMLKIMLKNNCF